MLDCAAYAFDNRNANVKAKVLFIPLLCLVNVLSSQSSQFINMAVYIHTSILERLDDAEFDLIIQSRVQQDCFGGIAHRATASLAVHSHRDGLVNICGGINVEMTIARAHLNSWHGCTRHHSINEARAAARNNQIHEPTRGNQVLHRVMRLTWQKLNRFTR